MRNIIIYIAAAFFEIFGCFAFWNYFKLQKTGFWLAWGVISLMVFAYLLTRIQVDFAGKAYAIYGGIYIAASVLWLYYFERQVPDKWDLMGAGICVIGALIILFMPR